MMTVNEAKKIAEDSKLTTATMRVVKILLGDDGERQLTSMEVRQLVALMEVEIENDREEAAKIDESILALKNFLSSVDNATDMLEKDLKSLE